MKAIINGKIILKDKIIENKSLIFEDTIIGIEDEVPATCEIIDAKGLYISPGLIDVHIHGSCGADAMDENLEAIKTISEGIAKNGVTSFLPTTMTMSKEDIYQALKNVRHWTTQQINGAKILGAHLEGPFINENYKGAQAATNIIVSTFEFIEQFADIIKIVSFAPELDKDFNFTKEVKEKTNITLSIGHSEATFSEAKAAIAQGCSHITHLFNAMTPLNHREPGVVGAALMSDTTCELIADKIHINPELFSFVLKNKGKENVVLITDSMRAGCMKDGDYDLGGQPVFVKDGAARLENGSLAGSVLTLNKAVKNFYDHTETDLATVIGLASLNPAKSIGISEQKGSLEIGKDADIVLFDEELNCWLTISEGRVIYNQLT